MTTHNNKPQENIEKCFEEIKQVLKKYECEIYGMYGNDVVIYDKKSSETKNYLSSDFEQ